MTQHHRRFHHERTDAAVLIVVNVAAANADRVNFDQDVIVACCLIELAIFNRNFARFLQNQRFHFYPRQDHYDGIDIIYLRRYCRKKSCKTVMLVKYLSNR